MASPDLSQQIHHLIWLFIAATDKLMHQANAALKATFVERNTPVQVMSSPEDLWRSAVAVQTTFEKKQTNYKIKSVCDITMCSIYWRYLLGRVGNLGRKSLDSSSELQNEPRALRHTDISKQKYVGDQKSFEPLVWSQECFTYLLSSATSIQCMQVMEFCTGNTWRISAFSTPHRTTCLVSSRLKASTGRWKETTVI